MAPGVRGEPNPSHLIILPSRHLAVNHFTISPPCGPHVEVLRATGAGRSNGHLRLGRRPRRPLLVGNVRRFAARPLGESCGSTEPAGRHADEAHPCGADRAVGGGDLTRGGPGRGKSESAEKTKSVAEVFPSPEPLAGGDEDHRRRSAACDGRPMTRSGRADRRADPAPPGMTL